VPNQLAGYILDLGKNRNKNAASDDTQTHTDGSTCIRVRFVVNLVRNESFVILVLQLQIFSVSLFFLLCFCALLYFCY